ncbi:MAG: hypothetical protein RJB13_2550 [Pseudomonadota bacterium]
MSKLKKPLRGLFASTEATIETPSRKAPPPAPKKDQGKTPSVPARVRLPAERLSPPPRIKPATPAMIMSEVEASPDDKQSRILTVHYNFSARRTEREGWLESDYAQFLNRLDIVQTEAFFLKGKLLAEAKERFYETNKVGWAEFCRTQLDMNYTTANQYIRVATEFDVTSHQRTDFGFEHFKALLPLSEEERKELLSTSETWSVKSLRTHVQDMIIKKQTVSEPTQDKVAQKKSVQFVRLLQNLKTDIQVNSETFRLLSQTQRWQVSAACQSIAAQLIALSQSLNDDIINHMSPTAVLSRAGAFATADGFDSMNTAEAPVSVPESPNL